MGTLLTSREVDSMFRWPSGRAKKLAKAGKLPHLILPDGEIRFDELEIENTLTRHPVISAPADSEEVALAR